MHSNIHTFDSTDETIRRLAEKIFKYAIRRDKEYFNLALSGGNSPLRLFQHLKEQYAMSMPWKAFKIFWVDERCVPPDHKESNYGMTYSNLLQHVGIPERQVYRIRGENPPEEESLRYASVIRDNLPEQNGFPGLDFVLLGMGSDGHTASIFPDQIHLFESKNLCEVTQHPDTGQKRITMSGRLINNAAYVTFLVTGEQKAASLSRVIQGKPISLPAALVHPTHGILEWFVDKHAAHYL